MSSQLCEELLCWNVTSGVNSHMQEECKDTIMKRITQQSWKCDQMGDT